MKAHERFMKYIMVDTTSDGNTGVTPSTPGQLTLGRMLAEELRGLGVGDARVDDLGYVYASIPANAEGRPAIGFIAHLDTIDDVPGAPMNARIIKNYDGGDVLLNSEDGRVMRAADYPELAARAGHDIIVTDGRTLLGADDKAGVAEIMTMVERLMSDPGIPHGKICIAFTPDEEIGQGADHFDVAAFGADFAYTVDGGSLPEVEYENFNAAGASIDIRGFNIHPGSAKNKMINSLLVGVEFAAMLPPHETPSHTEGYEGFFHLLEARGDEEHTNLKYLIRDHDRARFEARKQTMQDVADYLNRKYGEGTIALEVKDSYYNMKEMILPHMHIVERAMNAMRALSYEPKTVPIRGGTDGARLSFMGLPCPNLSTGGMNGHGRFECADINEMEDVVEILINIASA